MYTFLISALTMLITAPSGAISSTNCMVSSKPALFMTMIDVPASVKATVARLYPGVKRIKWEREGSRYEAGFTYNGKDLSLIVDAKGHLIETETGMAVTALPAAVREYVARHHAGLKIKEAAEIVDTKGKKTYEAEVDGKDLLFDEKGTFIK